MRQTVSFFLATLASITSHAGVSEPKRVALGESFQLQVGESARIESESLQIGFEDVAGDSRCPKGEQCIWEGDATVRVWLLKASETASETKETRELHTTLDDEGEVSYRGYEVKLQRLDPYPVSGKSIERGDYQATLLVTRESSSAAPER